MKIRITTQGVYGLPPSDEYPNGEYPIGYEFETPGPLPEGWTGKYHVLEHNAPEGAVAIVNVPADGASVVDGSVDDIAKHIEGVTDPDEIEKLIKAEEAGKNRKGAIAALEARRDELLAA